MRMAKPVLWALLIAGLAASLFVAAQRVRTESANRAVEIVVDWGEAQDIAAATGRSPVQVLNSLKSAGASSVAVTEMTFKDAVDEGLIVPASASRTYSVDPSLAGSLRKLNTLAPTPPGPARQSFFVSENEGRTLLTISGPPLDYVAKLPLGLPGSAIEAARSAGMQVVARPVNYPGATPESINREFDELKSMGINKVVFQGDTILGFKGATKATAAAFRRTGLCFGRVEFSKQKGETDLALRAKSNVIVVHSITQAEMPALDEPSIVERFTRGVRERGVRMCYVRMYYSASSDMLRENVDYLARISRSIVKAGYGLKLARPLVETRVPVALRVLAGVGVAAGAVLLLLAVFDLSFAAAVLWTIAAIAGCAGLAAFGDTGRKAVALLSALVFPTLAVLWAIRSAPESPRPVPGALARALWQMVVAVAVAAAGGLLIVGLLSSRDFMLRTNQFMGIKAAHLLPVLALALLFTGGIAWKADTWANQKRRLIERLREIAANPILLWQAAGLLAVLVIVGMMVARSGNDAGVEVSPLELRFRAILDRVLYVRPRTKEFLLGYPLLLAGIAFALRGRRQWAAGLVVVGSIGLVSALNTFCHIHTPLALSLVRVLNGVVVGGIIGAIGYLVVKNLPGKEQE